MNTLPRRKQPAGRRERVTDSCILNTAPVTPVFLYRLIRRPPAGGGFAEQLPVPQRQRIFRRAGIRHRIAQDFAFLRPRLQLPAPRLGQD